METYENRGYLREPFRLFHIRDQVSLSEIEYHYHDFHKVLLFVSGSASYVVEGRRYDLLPGDVIPIQRGCVHRPEVGSAAPYERYVLYLSPAWVLGTSTPACDLELCFSRARAEASYILRPDPTRGKDLETVFAKLEACLQAESYGSGHLAGLLVQQLLIALARLSLEPETPPVLAVYDEKIVRILAYLNDHLTQFISIDALAARFYISKYHMMRRFRAETGYSIHSYLAGKRLLYARDLLNRGQTATAACYQCGYSDYSTFARAYKKQFGCSPTSHKA